MVVSAAILLAPRYPLLAWRIGFLGVLVTPLIPGQNHVDAGYYVILMVTIAVAGWRYGPPRLWWIAALSLIPVWLWTPGQPADWAYPLRVTGVVATVTAAAYGAGRWRRDRAALATHEREARRQAELATRNAELARQRAERSAVLEERARIAREMHDVVAHHMSMIAVQAETAPYRVPDLPESAQAEFAALSAAAREALTDMRRLLGVLRQSGEPGGEDAIERAPQPGLADIPALVDTARRAGAEVALRMPEPATDVAPVVGLTAYRIVQESLSNAGRHAPGAPISVTVEQEAGSVRLNVENDAAGVAEPGGGGHGLAGMRERVALVGGTLRAGREAGGGFAVRAVLPARLAVTGAAADEGPWPGISS
jgi:signal transduction histidine kinase